MLPSQYRLPSSEIAHIAKTGKNIYSSELFFIKWISYEVTSPSQWAISVGLKVSKSAVVRNRIKRLFRAAILQTAQYADGNKFSGKFLIVARSVAIYELTSTQLADILGNLKEFN